MNISTTIAEICKKLGKVDGIGNKFHLTETVAWLLFLKCVDWEERELAEQSEISGEEYRPVIAGKFQWDSWAGQKSDLSGSELLKFISNDLFEHLKKIEGEDHLAQMIRSVFQHTNLYPKSGYRIKDCVELLNSGFEQKKIDKKQIRDEFDKILHKMTVENAKEHPRLFTPRPLCSLLIKLLNPKNGQRVYDPASGTAGLLIAAYSHLFAKAKTPAKIEVLKKSTLYGREKRDLQYMLGVINCYLHGISHPKLTRGNTLSINIAQIGEEDKYDIILCNPTFDSDEGVMVQNNFPIATKSVELMFLQHIEKSLSRGGRAAIILPEGTFFNTDSAHKAVKEKLFEKNNVHAIISLPQVGVKTSILLFDKKGVTKSVWMHRLVIPEGAKLTKKSGYKWEYFEDLLKKYPAKMESKNSKIVAMSDIIKKDYNISVSAYLETFGEESELLEPNEYLEEIDNLLNQSKENVSKLKQELKDVP